MEHYLRLPLLNYTPKKLNVAGDYKLILYNIFLLELPKDNGMFPREKDTTVSL